MPAGDIIRTKVYQMVKVLEGANAVTAVPAGAVGILLPNLVGEYAAQSSILIRSTAGGAACTGTFKAWLGFFNLTDNPLTGFDDWFPAGIGTADPATKGQLNNMNTIGPTQTNRATHAEPGFYLGMAERFYLQVLTLAGAPTFDAWLCIPFAQDAA